MGRLGHKLLEELAELEHQQWWEWTKELSESAQVHPGVLRRWKALWRPYAELSEFEKEQDRKYARRVLKRMSEHLGQLMLVSASG